MKTTLHRATGRAGIPIRRFPPPLRTRQPRRKVWALEVELRTLGKDDTLAEIEVADGELARAEAWERRLSSSPDRPSP
jgi:hypothetical protein